jgi:hypothetical protein
MCPREVIELTLRQLVVSVLSASLNHLWQYALTLLGQLPLKDGINIGFSDERSLVHCLMLRLSPVRLPNRFVKPCTVLQANAHPEAVHPKTACSFALTHSSRLV